MQECQNIHSDKQGLCGKEITTQMMNFYKY